jgi:uncharacterized membrane protein
MAEVQAWTDGVEAEAWFDPSNPWTPLPGVRTGAELSRGEKAADAVRNKMGSWGFVALFVLFMVFWAITNTLILRHNAWDAYPYILLNLFLSMLAGLQGAILLIAAKRADAVAAEQALSHLTISKTSGELIRELHKEVQYIKKLANEIHTLIELETKDLE